jgi:hypothetical protein
MLLLKIEPFLSSLGSVPNLMKASIIYFSYHAKLSMSYQIIHYYLAEEIACNDKISIEIFRDHI